MLEVYDVLDPGRNNIRTNVVFEINCARIIETKRNFGKNMVTKDDAEVSFGNNIPLNLSFLFKVLKLAKGSLNYLI